mmetsp:Transcript_12996/g.21249  ORF Transcript_12996/g.21249 Transcript_12996/m.21249 type:complete len:401 (-) Transcript_12996:155-1357(-)
MTTVSVNSTGPYGIVIEADKFGQAAVVKSWVRLPSGKFGQIQKCGEVNLGDVLVAINDVSVINTPFSDTKAMFAKSMPTKVLKFTSATDYYSRKKGIAQGKNVTGGKEGNNKNSFLSLIKRSRVNNFASTKFAEYEIVCQLKLASVSVDKDKTFKWSVWKRYSDFELLDTQLRKGLGWHMDTISFPSSHTFVMSKLSPDFLEQRREELNEYWQKVIAIDKVTEFNKHHCSAALKAFIDVDGALLVEKSAASDDTNTKESGEGTKESSGEDSGKGQSEGGGGTTQSKRNSSRRLSSRSGSNKSVMRRGSSASGSSKNLGATDEKDTPPPTPSVASSSSTASTASTQPPPAPTTKSTPKSTPAPTPTPTPVSRPSSSSSNMPPPATGARLNLLGSITALRKD